MIDLSSLTSPVLLAGNDATAFRDPAVLFHNDTFHLYYTLVEVEADQYVYSYTAVSTSTDLVQWTAPEKITPRDQKLNYCSPGNVIRYGGEWILCLQTYPRPGYTIDQAPRFGDATARVFIMRSTDLEAWSEPELLRVKGPDVRVEDMGRMIDPYLLEDKDEPGKWWCFYKQQGVGMSWSRDLRNWTCHGHENSGENVCVLVENDEYVLFHSPANGIGIKRSGDLIRWRDWGELITLGQAEWPWAQGRLTAGAVIDLRHVPGVGQYLMFFHGSRKGGEQKYFDAHASLGIAWSEDLVNWSWPGKG